MRTTAAALAVTLMLGCSYGGSKRTAQVGGVMLVASLAGLAAAGAVRDTEEHAGGSIALVAFSAILLYGGLALGIGGLAGMAIHDKPAPAPSQPATKYTMPSGGMFTTIE